MGDMVIVAYQPKPGCEQALLDLVRDHVPFLNRLGLATDRDPILMRARDGILVEVFEWQKDAIEKAHNMPAVQELWAKYEKLCEYVPLNQLPETKDMFAEFTAIDL